MIRSEAGSRVVAVCDKWHGLCRYGLIDRIVQPQDAVAMDEKNYEAILQKSQANQRGGSRQPEGAEAGY